MLRCDMITSMAGPLRGQATKPEGEPSMIPQSILCLINRHKPDRNKARWDGFHYVGACTACGREVYRLKSKTWRAIGSG